MLPEPTQEDSASGTTRTTDLLPQHEWSHTCNCSCVHASACHFVRDCVCIVLVLVLVLVRQHLRAHVGARACEQACARAGSHARARVGVCVFACSCAHSETRWVSISGLVSLIVAESGTSSNSTASVLHHRLGCRHPLGCVVLPWVALDQDFGQHKIEEERLGLQTKCFVCMCKTIKGRIMYPEKQD